MSKISVSFLVGFTMIASVGVATAQTGADALSNSVASRVMSMDGMQAKVTISEAKPNPYAAAASSLTGAPGGKGTGIDIPVVNAKIGAGGSDFSLPSNALTDKSKDGAVNLAANALQAAGGETSGMQAGVVLGAGGGDMSNAIGDQIRSNQRLGK